MIPPRVEAYRSVAPRGSLDLLLRLAERLRGRRFAHVNTSRFGAGSAELLTRIVPMLQDLGIDTTWEVIVGTPDFYTAVGRMERSLAGVEPAVPEAMLGAYSDVVAGNAATLPLEADLVMTHDVAPLGLARHRPQRGHWVWRCHSDLSRAYRRTWAMLRRDVERHDAAIFSLPKFAQRLPIPTLIVHPSIDPLSEKNRELTRTEIAGTLERFKIPRDKPIIIQVSPHTRAKDPAGTVRAYRLAKKYADCRLILAGPSANDHREGQAVLNEISEAASGDPEVHVLALPPDAALEINALQRAATVVVHRPLYEDFGLAVAESMWKGKPVVGSFAGGIPAQVIPEVTGFAVTSIEGAAFRIRQLLEDLELATRLGGAGREYVRRSFLITRHLGDYLALLASLTN
ncbi:MAG TPA: glycosyltransferase [Candidatus Methylomirabilis sp.]|nr:glycosyltransferase [Candidatus Methylomirabilis sp.]